MSTLSVTEQLSRARSLKEKKIIIKKSKINRDWIFDNIDKISLNDFLLIVDNKDDGYTFMDKLVLEKATEYNKTEIINFVVNNKFDGSQENFKHFVKPAIEKIINQTINTHIKLKFGL